MEVLDRLPLATLSALASIVIVVVASLKNDLSVEEGLIALGAVNVGNGAWGISRSLAGKGVREGRR